MKLTVRQHQVLRYVHAFLCANHQLPPKDKIATDFGWSSGNAAFDVLRALERKGYLERNEIGNQMLSAAGMEAALLPVGRA